MTQLPYQILELSVISAQDLAAVSRKLRTYAITWINPERKLRTRIDQQGQINPTWNDKFVFRVDDKFLESDTSSVMVEIYALGWLRDIPIGSVRVLISNLVPHSVREKGCSSRRFVALQIRRPSGRPQGILNMGVTLLDNTMRSMPLYRQLSASAVGFQDLMDVKLYKQHEQKTEDNDEKLDGKTNEQEKENDEKLAKQNEKENDQKLALRRTQSDRTDLTSKEFKKKVKKGKKGSSLIHNNGSVHNDSSMVIGSIHNGSSIHGSVVNGSELGGAKGGSLVNSDVGPSPSVVAAAVARGLYPTPLGAPHKPGSSILGDWTVDDDSSVEGLKSKIERWRMEFPSVYDHENNYQKLKKSKSAKHIRRNTDGASLFSCFGNSYGCEFRIVCGGQNGKKNKAKYKNRLLHSDGGSSSITI